MKNWIVQRYQQNSIIAAHKTKTNHDKRNLDKLVCKDLFYYVHNIYYVLAWMSDILISGVTIEIFWWGIYYIIIFILL